MRALPRLILWAVPSVAVFVGAAWGVTSLRSSCLASLDLAGAGQALMAEVNTHSTLSARDDAVRRCVLGKQQVIEDLFAERTSVREAGEEFRRLEDELVQSEGGRPDGIEAAVQVGSDDGSVYQNLLRWAEAAAWGMPERASRVAQIEAEVNAILHRSPVQRA